MCIAIMIPPGKGQFLTNEMLEDCYLVNSDGIGYAFPNKEGGLIVKKFMVFEEFMAEWEEDKKVNKKLPIMLHFRATSVGATNEDNCHPFVINKKQVFCHNGTIHKVAKDPKKEASDTRMFNRLFLRNLPDKWEYNLPTVTMMEHYIGTSKLIVLNADKSFTIINEDLGKWEGGIWFSNEHYTGKYTRGTGGFASRKTAANNFNRHTNNHQSASDSFALAAAKRQKKREKKRKERKENQRRIAYDQHPTEDMESSESMCEWCNKPFDESELILTDFGPSKALFSVCHTCANKIQFDDKDGNK